MGPKIAAMLEVLLVYAVMQALGIALRSAGIVQWELSNLGWTYAGSLVFVGVPALVIWLKRQPWAEYGVTTADWPTNVDIGLKAYLVQLIPYAGGLGAVAWLQTSYTTLLGGGVAAVAQLAAVAVMLRVLLRQKRVESGGQNLVIVGLLLLVPIAAALSTGRLGVIIVSTVVWQFVCSGFGEEFTWRGYVQTRLNQAWGRPFQVSGVAFGPGLIVTSLLFGLLHAFNTYDPAVGFASLSWGWALFTACGGLFFGLIREKTGSLVACGLAHGLPDAVGETLGRVFGWM